MLFHFPNLKSQGWCIFLLKILVLSNDIKNVFRAETVPSRAKKQQSIGIKNLFTQTTLWF